MYVCMYVYVTEGRVRMEQHCLGQGHVTPSSTWPLFCWGRLCSSRDQEDSSTRYSPYWVTHTEISCLPNQWAVCPVLLHTPALVMAVSGRVCALLFITVAVQTLV